MRALIVEDDEGGRFFLAKIISQYCECDAVFDGSEAIEACEAAWREGQPYDLIFMDIMLPIMSGHEVIRIIREKERELGFSELRAAKVIMTSALDDERNVNRAFYEGGAVGYLVKPFDRSSVSAEMHRLGLI